MLYTHTYIRAQKPCRITEPRPRTTEGAEKAGSTQSCFWKGQLRGREAERRSDTLAG